MLEHAIETGRGGVCHLSNMRSTDADRSQIVTSWRATFCATSFLNCQVSLFYMAGSVF
jgi:hypothetical protein